MSVPSAELSFTRMGAGSTRAKRDQAQPAELVFYAIYLSKVRGGPKPEPRKFAKLEGEALLEGATPTPVFRGKSPATGDEPLSYDEPLETTSPRTRPRRRSILLELSTQSFKDVLPPDTTSIRLFLPHPEDEQARFAEIDTELRIGGDVEAPLGRSHPLDLPLPPLEDGPMFEWPDDLTQQLPEGLTLTLTEGGKSMSLQWDSGSVAGGLRRFAFSRLPGVAPCTLVARAASRELTLFADQDLADLQAPLVWQHWLEEMTLPPTEDDGDVAFAAFVPAPTAK